MQTFMALLHGLDYLTTHALIGVIIFYSFILKAGGAEAQLVNFNWIQFLNGLTRLSFVITFLWMMAAVHDMAETWDFSMIWMGMAHTSLSHMLCLKLLFLACFMVFLKLNFLTKQTSTLFVISALLLPLGNVIVSHAASFDEYFNYKLVLDWIHSMAVGVWTGGLVALYFWLDQKIKSTLAINPEVSHQVVKRFSHFAMASTFFLGTTGIFLAISNGVSILNPWETRYGQLVLVKTALFCITLLAAGFNQFLHLRTWHPEREFQFANAVRREVGLEIVLITFIFFIAGFLTRTALPGS